MRPPFAMQARFNGQPSALPDQRPAFSFTGLIRQIERAFDHRQRINPLAKLKVNKIFTN